MKAEGNRRGPPPGFPALPVIPGGRYIDPTFLALEKDGLWRRSWLYALQADELPEVGSYRLWRRTGAPIVIIRGKDNQIRAFYNTCRHRGAPLVEDEAGHIKNFYCRYHAWTYDDLNGALDGVTEKRDFPDLDMSCVKLSEVHCELFGNWVFINEDPDAEPLLQHLGPIPEHWDNLQIDKLRFIKTSSFEIACNVKVLLDAFFETYHLKSIHPKTVDRFLDSRGTHIVLWKNGHSMMTTPHRKAEWRDPGAEGMPTIPTADRLFAEQNPSYLLYPKLVTPPSATGIPFLTFWPKTDRTMVVDVHWFGPEGSVGHPLWETCLANFARILAEDTQFAPRIQESVETKGFKGMRLSYQERRIYHWHEELDRRIGAERIAPELRVPSILSDYVETE
jgi:phenylpropionate dioxygenase-like ring-hydroxylating dioxygenase large terminal subunit